MTGCPRAAPWPARRRRGGSVGDSFVIAGWAFVGGLLRLIAGLAAIWFVLSNAAITGSTFEALAGEVVAALTLLFAVPANFGSI